MIIKNIQSEVLSYCIDLFEFLKKHTSGVEIETLTINGFQTKNVINFFTEEIKLKILNNYNLLGTIKHVHFIEYFNDGFQKEHNHQKTERDSFILYLNDSDGDTVFKLNNEEIKVKPEKGKIVFFDSKIFHYALPSFLNKKVMVGAII
jgi:hypothetical protein